MQIKVIKVMKNPMVVRKNKLIFCELEVDKIIVGLYTENVNEKNM